MILVLFENKNYVLLLIINIKFLNKLKYNIKLEFRKIFLLIFNLLHSFLK